MLTQLKLAVRDVRAVVAFYERLGLTFTVTPDGAHAEARMANGVSLELDAISFIPRWDSGWRGATGGGAARGFEVASREDVDRLYEALTVSGHRAHQPPHDAFCAALARPLDGIPPPALLEVSADAVHERVAFGAAQRRHGI